MLVSLLYSAASCWICAEFCFTFTAFCSIFANCCYSFAYFCYMFAAFCCMLLHFCGILLNFVTKVAVEFYWKNWILLERLNILHILTFVLKCKVPFIVTNVEFCSDNFKSTEFLFKSFVNNEENNTNSVGPVWILPPDEGQKKKSKKKKKRN